MKTRTCLGAVLGTISVCLLLASPMAMADKAAGAYKLEGAWVAKVQGLEGQWSYVLAPDASGRRAAGHGSVDLGFNPDYAFGCEFGAMDYADSPILISLEMTGPDTAIGYSVWYAIRTPSPGAAEIVFIGEVRTEVKFVAPGKSESAHASQSIRNSIQQEEKVLELLEASKDELDELLGVLSIEE